MKASTTAAWLALLAVLTAMPTRAQDDGATEPARCVNLQAIDETEIIDERHIAFFMRNDDVYLNQLDSRCMGLSEQDAFAYRTSTNSLCRGDTITVIESGLFGRTGASCRLGIFEPSHADEIEAMKNGVDDAEVTVTPIEIEPAGEPAANENNDDSAE